MKTRNEKNKLIDLNSTQKSPMTPHEQRIKSLTFRNNVLKTHLDYLRTAIKERDYQIELCTEVMLEMESDNDNESDQYKFILN
jgi:hypothetical protein